MKAKRILAAVLSSILALGLLAGCNANAAPAASTTNEAAAANTADTTTDDTDDADDADETEDTDDTGAVEAADWPTGSVQLLVPSKAGGVTDIYTRYVQKSLQTSTSANFATVNYDTEAVGYETLRSAAADGNTLLLQHSTLICKYLTGAVEYDPLAEFDVVGVIADMGGQAIIVHPDAPYDTWEEFIEYAKEHPGELNTGIATNGTTHFIFGQVQDACGVDLNFVECSAEADKLTNVAGGIIDVANCSLSNAKEYEEAGMLKVLGILGSGEAEAEYPDWEPITDVIWNSYLYVFAPDSIDAATAQAVNNALATLVDDPDYVEECASMGGEAMYLNLEESQKHFEDTMEDLYETATNLGINVR